MPGLLGSGPSTSAFRLAVVVSSSFTEPPTAKTLPSGKITAFISIRALLMLGPDCHAGVGAPKSMISLVLVAGLWPPMMITFGS